MTRPPRARCCEEHTRAEILRRGAAQAGAGLPTIEPGMPMPAGTGLDRRMFLARSAGLMLAVYGAGTLGMNLFEEGIAHAGVSPGAGERVLVSVFLDGGIDSLSVLSPTGDPRYRNLRSQLALGPNAGQAFSEDARLRWHPLASPLATLHAEGKLSVATAIGYDEPDQSHFTSRHYYEVGATDANLRTGWLGRTLDVIGTHPETRRVSRPGFAAALAAVLLGTLAVHGTAADAEAAYTASDRKRGPARLLMSAKEFSYVLSRQKLRAGPVVIQLANAGEDAHNLRLRRIGAKRNRLVPRAEPGERAELSRKLKPGRYYLWCSIADHEERGMRARLLVKRR